MQLQSKSKGFEIFEGITQLSWKDRGNQLLLHNYKREVRELLSKKPYHGFILQGIIATIERQLDKVHDNFRKALNLTADNFEAISNYAISLGFLGYYAEALEIVERAYEQAPANLTLLDTLIFQQYYSGRIHDAYLSTQKWDKLHSAPHFSSENLRQAVQILDESNLTDELIQKFRESTVIPLQKRNIYLGFTKVIVQLDDENAWIQYDIVPDISGERFDEAEEELYEIIDKTPSSITDFVEIQYTDPELNDFVVELEQKKDSLNELVEIDEEQMHRIGRLVGEIS